MIVYASTIVLHQFINGELLFIYIFQNVEVEEQQRVDERSVDDLLSFINGGDGGILMNFIDTLRCGVELL